MQLHIPKTNWKPIWVQSRGWFRVRCFYLIASRPLSCMAFLVIVDICINVLSLFKVFQVPLSMFLFFCYLFEVCWIELGDSSIIDHHLCASMIFSLVALHFILASNSIGYDSWLVDHTRSSTFHMKTTHVILYKLIVHLYSTSKKMHAYCLLVAIFVKSSFIQTNFLLCIVQGDDGYHH